MGSLRIVLMLAAVAGCAGRSSLSSTIISPANFANLSAFTDEELRQPAAVRNLRETPEASFQVVRIKDRFGPRSHAGSDAVLMVVSGRVRVTLGKDDYRLSPGNVVELPREAVYDVVNQDSSASVVYLVYTPKLAPDDVKTVHESTRESAWKWNLWTN